MKKFIISFLLIIFIQASRDSVIATVDVSHHVNTQDNSLIILYTTNHDYIKQDIPIFYQNNIKPLDLIKEQLVRKEIIQDLPIVFNHNFDLDTSEDIETKIIKKDDCRVGYIDYSPKYSQEQVELGDCYWIEYSGEQSDLESYILTLLELHNLSEDNQEIVLSNLNNLKANRQSEIDDIKNFITYTDVRWSPNSEYVIATKWNSGKISFDLLKIQDMSKKEITLDNNPVMYPVWSESSSYLAIAAMQDVVLYDVNQNKIHQFVDINTKYRLESNNQILVAFNSDETTLQLALDQSYFANYQSLEIILAEKRLHVLAESSVSQPSWAQDIDQIRYQRQEEAISPNNTNKIKIKDFIDRFADEANNENVVVSDLVLSEPVTIPEETVTPTVAVSGNLAQDEQRNDKHLIPVLVILSLPIIVIVIVAAFIYQKKKKFKDTQNNNLNSLQSDKLNKEQQQQN